jgi:putative spermidine/putrescine transport system permease protein
MNDPMIIEAYAMSLRISITTAIIGAILGLLVAYAITVGGLPHGIRTAILTFSGVASNFAGVPLAFAFVATLGRTGIITALLAQLGINLYKNGFNLYSYAGLVLVYVYFQFPLMVLVMTPALDGLRREWREASAILGANTAQDWWHVALPLLTPAILAGMVLLFGNAFGAFATAYALTGGTFTMVTNVIAQEMSGDVLHNEALAYALATGMIVIMTITIGTYTLLQRRAERWLRA